MLGYVRPAPMPHSRTPCKETSTSAYGWATKDVNKSQTLKIKIFIQEGCSSSISNGILCYTIHHLAQRTAFASARTRRPAARLEAAACHVLSLSFVFFHWSFLYHFLCVYFMFIYLQFSLAKCQNCVLYCSWTFTQMFENTCQNPTTCLLKVFFRCVSLNVETRELATYYSFSFASSLVSRRWPPIISLSLSLSPYIIYIYIYKHNNSNHKHNSNKSLGGQPPACCLPRRGIRPERYNQS